MSPSHGKMADKTLDISDDLVSGTMTIRTNAVHTFNFQLQNAQRKYDLVLQPMDRITVEMKRITWVRVFSGYLNNGPIFSAWPRVLSISASCALKRLQFWYWDSTTSASNTVIQGLVNSGTVTDPQAPATTPVGTDANIRAVAVKLLTDVVGWPQEKIHISEIPANWGTFADAIAQKIVTDNDVTDLLGAFTSTASIGGSTVSGAAGSATNGSLIPGSYGGTALTQSQANIAAQIYNAAQAAGVGTQGAVIGIAVGMAESSLANLNYGDLDSLGVFQQRPSQGWGTAAQVQDVNYAANTFFTRLKAIPNWQSMSPQAAAQAVQRSGTASGSNYAKWLPMAQAATSALAASPGGSAASSAVGGSASSTVNSSGADPAAVASNTTAPPVGSGRNVALVAANLINRNPPGHILYHEGGDSSYDSADPTTLDCSSLVDWVYFHAVGKALAQPRTTAAVEQTMSQSIPVSLATSVKGALLFIGNPASHVEVSLGNGKTAAAHTDAVPAAQQVNISNASGFTSAGLLPGVNYSDAATNATAATQLAAIIHQPTTVSDPNETGTGTDASGGAGGGTADAAALAQAAADQAFNKAINVYQWGLTPNLSGDLLVGARALMNDEPILPYIGNLMSACLRSWCSAPNGDFIAWFPDYFGIWNAAAAMEVRSIELQDFTVEWLDQNIVTHQYVVGTPIAYFNPADASVSGQTPNSSQTFGWAMTTSGIATMDYPEIFRAIFGDDASAQFVSDYLARFGGRPNTVNMPMLTQDQHGKPGSEFFMALYLFMQRWANQFQATVPMTFMPELWPGMLLRLPEFGFQCYITEVTHNFSFGPGGGFTTSAKVVAPARIGGSQSDILGMLPIAGAR